MPVFYDTHAHLDFPDFKVDLPEVVERAGAAGIEKIVTIGTTLESSARAVALAERFPSVYAAVGCHPSYAAQAPQDLRPDLRRLAAHPKVIAIGEIGLDYYRLPSGKGGSAQDDRRYKEKQASLFEQQLELAAELGLNCIVHQRESFQDVLRHMQAHAGKVRGVFHCFSQPPDQLGRVLELGSLVSFTGIVTFKNAQAVRETVAATPPDRFMLETDCPFLTPVPYRGKRCEPAHVKEIAGTIAGIHGCTLEELSASTCATARAFFRL
jgi:TatD DNase family protein